MLRNMHGVRARVNPLNQRIRMQKLPIGAENQMAMMNITTRSDNTSFQSAAAPLVRIPRPGSQHDLGIPREKGRLRKAKQRQGICPHASSRMPHGKGPVFNTSLVGLQKGSRLTFQAAHHIFAATILAEIQRITLGSCGPLNAMLQAKQT